MTETQEIEVKTKTKIVIAEVSTLAKRIENYQITSQDSYLEAGEYLKDIKDRIHKIDDLCEEYSEPFKRAKQKAEEGRKNVEDFFSRPLLKLKELKGLIEIKVTKWRAAQQEKERLAREKAEAEARDKERLEKERLRKEAEVKEIKARKAQEEARAAQKNAEDLTRQESFQRAEKARLEAEKKAREAEALKEQAKEKKQEAKAVEIKIKEVKPKVEKIEGLNFRRIWKFRIINPARVPIQFCIPNEVKIGNAVKEYKDKTNIPGIEVFYEDISISQNG